MATATLQQTQIIVSDSSSKETRKSPVEKVTDENRFANFIKSDKKPHPMPRALSSNKEKQDQPVEGIFEEMPFVSGDELSFEHAKADGLVEDQGQDQDVIEELVQVPQFLSVLPQSFQGVQEEAVKLDLEDGQVQVEEVDQEMGVAAVGLAVLQPAEEVLAQVVDSVLPAQNLPKENQIKISNDNNPNSQVIAQQDGQFTLGAEMVEPPVNLSQIDNHATRRYVIADAGKDKAVISALQREEMTLLTKTVVDVVGKEDIAKHDISGSVKVQKQSAVMPELVTVSANLVLADETMQGKSVIAKLDTSSAKDGLDQVIGEPISISALAKKLASDNEQSGDSDIMSKDDLLMISSGITASAGNEFTKELGISEKSVYEQVASSIKEMLVAQDNNGKKEITINLFPEKLGAVKVEIISVLGEDGARKVESIKFVAEKRETLEILEKSRLELEKTLKEVTSTNEETSLEFEMNRDGQNGQAGAYFDSLKERDNWMNSFLTFNDIDNEIMQGQVSDDHSRGVGHITEDSVDIRI